MQHEIAVGARYCWKGLTIRVIRIEDETATVQPAGSTLIVPALIADLAPLPSEGETLAPAMQVREDVWTRSVELADACKAVLALPDGKTTAMRGIAHTFGISERAAYNILNKYKENPTPWALVPCRPGRKPGTRVLLADIELKIASTLEKHYLTEEKPTLSSATEVVRIACEKDGLPVPSRNTIRARIDALELAERIKRREGRKRAREVCNPAAGHVAVDRPLQRVEVDHTLCDVALVANTTSRELLGRPWLTIAIDYYTRMVLGIYISFVTPSSVSVALCLAHALLPKIEWLKALGVPGMWPAFGFPEEIWVDNAMEFRAIALRRGCERNNIKLCYRPAGQPQVGGAIERLIGTTMGRVHLLPGTTQSNVRDRGAYDSEGRASMTLREFTTWLTVDIVTRYLTTTHRGIGKPPLFAWNEYFASRPVTSPGAPLEILADFLPAQSRTLRRTGIELSRLKYWCPDLAAWVGEARNVTVHAFPLDPQRVYVRLPNGQLTIAHCTSAGAVADKCVIDHLLQVSSDAQLEKQPDLQALRHAGHDLGQSIVEKAKLATSAARKAGKALPELSQTMSQGVRLYRPNASALCVFIPD